MSGFPPLMRDQRPIDDDHLRFAAALHFALAGLGAFGLTGLIASYFMVSDYLGTPHLWRIVPEAPPEFVMRRMMDYSYTFSAFVLIGIVACNIASGLCLRRRKYRMFSLMIAGLNSLLVPVGTALACFTYVVLMQESVRETYLDD